MPRHAYGFLFTFKRETNLCVFNEALSVDSTELLQLKMSEMSKEKEHARTHSGSHTWQMLHLRMSKIALSV